MSEVNALYRVPFYYCNFIVVKNSKIPSKVSLFIASSNAVAVLKDSTTDVGSMLGWTLCRKKNILESLPDRVRARRDAFCRKEVRGIGPGKFLEKLHYRCIHVALAYARIIFIKNVEDFSGVSGLIA